MPAWRTSSSSPSPVLKSLVLHSTRPITSSAANGSLSPLSASSTAATFRRTCVPRSAAKTAAASVEDTAAPSRSAVVQPRPMKAWAASATTPAVSEHAERGQQAGRAERAHHLRALGQEAALEQDDHQRDRARVARERGVVELDPAGPVLAEEHAEAEEHEQRRSPEPVDEARGDRAHEEHHGRDDEWLGDVQLCCSSRAGVHASCRAGGRGGTGGPRPPRSTSLRRDE